MIFEPRPNEKHARELQAKMKAQELLWKSLLTFCLAQAMARELYALGAIWL